MIIFACVDDRYGMRFNHRRQSADRTVIDKIIELSRNRKIWMEYYSALLFPETANICIEDNFLQRASCDDCCFVERVDISRHLNRVNKIVLFHWNRRYPADLFFPENVLIRDWRVVESVDFPGTSHENITMKVYEREK